MVALRDELGVTSVVVTHDLASAFLISDRLAMLAERRIVAIDTPAAFRQSAVPAVQEFLGAMPSQGQATTSARERVARAQEVHP